MLDREGIQYGVAIEPEVNVACICTFANEKREGIYLFADSTTCIAAYKLFFKFYSNLIMKIYLI